MTKNTRKSIFGKSSRSMSMKELQEKIKRFDKEDVGRMILEIEINDRKKRIEENIANKKDGWELTGETDANGCVYYCTKKSNGNRYVAEIFEGELTDLNEQNIRGETVVEIYKNPEYY